MDWSLIVSGCMGFFVLTIIRLLLYINIPINNGKKIIRILSIPDIRNRDSSGEALVFLYQCASLLLIFLGFAYQNVLSIIASIMPSVRHLDGYVSFGLSMFALALPVVQGLIIQKMYWSNTNREK
jgi:hypothetical protein